MIRRRAFVAALGVSLVVPARVLALQAPRVPRVGYLFSFTPSAGRQLWEACRHGLRDLGYVETRNIILEPRWADGHHERLSELSADLVQLKVDVIVSAATPASRAAKAATNSIPIVFVAVAEPIKAGLVASLARPGGHGGLHGGDGSRLIASLARPGRNVTGLSSAGGEVTAKQLELMKEIVPVGASSSSPRRCSGMRGSSRVQPRRTAAA